MPAGEQAKMWRDAAGKASLAQGIPAQNPPARTRHPHLPHPLRDREILSACVSSLLFLLLLGGLSVPKLRR